MHATILWNNLKQSFTVILYKNIMWKCIGSWAEKDQSLVGLFLSYLSVWIILFILQFVLFLPHIPVQTLSQRVKPV